MGLSRYRNLNTLEGYYLETPNTIAKEDLDKITCINIRPTSEDRLDALAHRYLGDSSYWWVICLMNDLEWIFDFEPGKILRIPIDVQDILDLI